MLAATMSFRNDGAGLRKDIVAASGRPGAGRPSPGRQRSADADDGNGMSSADVHAHVVECILMLINAVTLNPNTHPSGPKALKRGASPPRHHSTAPRVA